MQIKIHNLFFPLLLLAALGTAPLLCWGEESATCLQCHSSTANVAVHSIFNTAHAHIAPHQQSPTSQKTAALDAGNATCVSCHGVSQAHQLNPIANAPTISFGPRWQSTPDQKDSLCLGCHRKGDTLLWHGSEHQLEGMACNSCHALHKQIDPVLQRPSQAKVCFACHTQQQSQAHLPSHHPISEGKTACSDCHNAHGSATDFLLSGVTLNDTCFSCHAEKRGPFLFEHAPVEEDCSICHEAHGTVNEHLLSSRGPFLCQQCHSAAFHPSRAFSGDDVFAANKNVVAKNCMNCHSQVHGSNHPSGAYLTR